jgi:hypothetical protein
VTEQQPPRGPLDLRRPRDVGGLISEGLGLYFREFRTFFLIALAVVVPVEVIVCGIGLGWLTSDYDSTPGAAALIPAATATFVIMPLVTAASIYALLDVADGRKPRVGSAIQRALDVFAPLVLVIVMYAAGVALGLIALIVPGIYLIVTWGFAVQATVVDGRRGVDSLRRSHELVRGTWWRVAGVTIVTMLLVNGLGSLINAPFLAAANSTGSAVFQLVALIVSGTLIAPPAALIITLLYFDQRLRKAL